MKTKLLARANARVARTSRLTLLGLATVASVITVAPSAAADEVQVRSDASDLTFTWRNKSGVVAECRGKPYACVVDLEPGPYALWVDGPPDSDWRRSVKKIEIEEPSRVTVSPARTSLRYVGLGLGVTGLAVLGYAFVSGGAALHDNRVDANRHYTGVRIALVSGLLMNAVGWTLFAVHRGASVEVEPRQPRR